MATTINGSTGASQIQDNTVSNAKVVDDAIGIAELSATGTASSSTFLRGDNAWAAAGGGMTLLDTLTTTSGTSHVAGSLDLSTYKYLYVAFYNVGWATDGEFLQWKETGGTSVYITAQIDAGNNAYGLIVHDLALGIATSTCVETSAGATLVSRQDTTQGMINTPIDTATTSITFDWSAGTDFNAGTIKLYGLK
jgi:hypothetical protein